MAINQKYLKLFNARHTTVQVQNICMKIRYALVDKYNLYRIFPLILK